MEKSSDSFRGNVVLNLWKNVQEPTKHVVFFDNYFSTIHLMSRLTQNGVRATATIRVNRLAKCPLEASKSIAKQQRGTFDYQFDKCNDLLVVRWVDNNVVNIISNYDTIEPLQKVKRWSKRQKQFIDVSQPLLYKTYNNRMGGVDLSDQSVTTYRIGIRCKKWWWVLFTYMPDLAMTNVWKVYLLVSNNKISQLEFTSKSNQSGLPCVLNNLNDEQLTKPGAIVDGFADFFQSVYIQPTHSLSNSAHRGVDNARIDVSYIDESDVFYTLKKLKNSNTMGDESDVFYTLKKLKNSNTMGDDCILMNLMYFIR
ncbi:Transposase IS4 [Popillia japonica]|uniref:Transposase IS4 n=1 Tax=Popillia japonica TaxID=7064 RepID=A0AAW1IZE4_POPJA